MTARLRRGRLFFCEKKPAVKYRRVFDALNEHFAPLKNFSMKKLLLLAAPILLFSFCNKSDDGPSLDMVLPPLEFTMPAGTNNFQTYHFYVKNVPTSYFSLLAAAGKTTDDVRGVVASSGVMEADFASAEYKYFQEVSIKVYDEAAPNVDLEAFYQDIISVNAGNQLILNPSLADLSNFMKNDKVSLDIAIRPRGTTPESIPSHLTLAFKIKI